MPLHVPSCSLLAACQYEVSKLSPTQSASHCLEVVGIGLDSVVGIGKEIHDHEVPACQATNAGKLWGVGLHGIM